MSVRPRQPAAKGESPEESEVCIWKVRYIHTRIGFIPLSLRVITDDSLQALFFGISLGHYLKHLTRHLKFFFLSLFLGVLFTNCSPFQGQVYNSSSPTSQNSDQSQQQGDGTSDSQTNLPIPAGTSAPSTSSYSGTFFTLHQHPITFVKSSALDPQGQLTFVKTEPLVDFQKQFPPSGTSGCVMGYPEYRHECDSVNGGFGFTLEGLSYHTEYRVYVPAGTTFFGTSGYRLSFFRH